MGQVQSAAGRRPLAWHQAIRRKAQRIQHHLALGAEEVNMAGGGQPLFGQQLRKQLYPQLPRQVPVAVAGKAQPLARGVGPGGGVRAALGHQRHRLQRVGHFVVGQLVRSG